jgi:hypothetical protein
LQDGSAAGAPEVLSGEERAAAGGAGWGIDVRVFEEDSRFREAVEVGGVEDFVQSAAAFVFGVSASEPAPIVGKKEEDVWSLGGGLRG